MMVIKKLKWVVLVLLGIGLYLAISYDFFRSHTTVFVKNVGQTTIKNVRLSVVRQEYNVGDVALHATRKVALKVSGESSVEIIVDGKRLNFGMYLEPSYKGNLFVNITNDDVVWSSYYFLRPEQFLDMEFYQN